MASRRSCAAASSPARTRQMTSSVAALDQPREQLHAEEAGRAGEQDGLAHRSGAPIAWKPPSTCRISPVIARARSLKQEADGGGDGSRVAGVPAERRARAPERREIVEARDAARRNGLDRAGRDEVDADPARLRGRARGSATRSRAPPSRPPSSRRPARRRRHRSRGRRPSRRPRRPRAAARAPRRAPSARRRWSQTR